MGLRPKGVSGTHDIFGLSENLWGNYPIDWIFGARDQDYGWGVMDSFKNWSIVTAITDSLGIYSSEGNTYRTFELAGGSSAQNIVPDDTIYTVPTGYPIQNSPAGNVPNGVANVLYPAGTVLWTPGQLKLMGSGSAAQNDQAQIQMGPQTTAANVCPFTTYPGRSGTLLFECRLKFSALATANTTFFIGLAGSGSAITSVPAAASAYDTTTSKLGFGCLQSDSSNVLSLVYSRTTGTVRTISSLLTLGSFPNSTYPTIGPTSYFKLGFRYESKAQRLIPFVNGVALDGNTGTNCIVGPSTVSGSSSSYGTSSTSWPLDGMTLAAGLFQYGTTIQTVTLDWWAAAQMPTVGAHGLA